MTALTTQPRVLDTAALLAVARGDTYALTVIGVVLHAGGPLVVPCSALAAAVASHPAAEPRLLLLTEHPHVEIDDLTAASARWIGRLLARTQAAPDLLPSAHVAYAAAERDHCPVLAGEPACLRRIDPELTLDEI